MTMYKRIEALCREARNLGGRKEIEIPLESIRNYNTEYVRRVLRKDFGFQTKIIENRIGDIVIRAY